MATTLTPITDWYAGNLRHLIFDVTDADHGDMPLDLSDKEAKWSLAVVDGGAYSTEPVLEKKSDTGDIDVAPQKIATAVPAAAGTGYVVGDELLVLGGEGDQAYVTVATIGGSGTVTGVTISSAGTYSTTPTSPAATSGGSGVGCTLTLTFGSYSGRLLVTVLSADVATLLGEYHEELELFDADGEAEVVAVRDVTILANVVNT